MTSLFSQILSASAALALVAAPAFSFAADTFQLKDTAGSHLDVLQGGKIVGRYMYGHDTSTKEKREETTKPFLHVFDAEGKSPITKGAGGTLPHHRGIYIGWNGITVEGREKTTPKGVEKIKYDRWHMKSGDQVHEKFTEQKADDKGATITSFVKWEGDNAQDTIIEEERTMRFLPGTSPVYTVVDVTSKLKAVAGDTSLNLDAEHSGLQFRPANEVDRKQTRFLLPKAGADAHKDKGYPWFGETFSTGGKLYSVVYLSHPSNPKDATISAYRDYGRFGQTWALTIPKGQTQEFRARFLVAEGKMLSPETIQKAWNEYAGREEPVPQVTEKAAEGTKFADPNNPNAAPAPKAEKKPKVAKEGEADQPKEKGAETKPAKETAVESKPAAKP